MDVEQASQGIDALIERRSKERSEASAIAELWAASERAHRENRRRENAAAWHAFNARMQDLHAALSEEHRAKAEKLRDHAIARVSLVVGQGHERPGAGGGV